jgi:hypothetical protein
MTIEHSDAYYDYKRNDPNAENPFTDPKDWARAINPETVDVGVIPEELPGQRTEKQLTDFLLNLKRITTKRT